MSNADIERTIGFCTQLCAAGGIVIWTRGRWAADGEPDLVPQVCAWFVGSHRRTAAPLPLDPAATMFSFTAHDPVRGPRRTV